MSAGWREVRTAIERCASVAPDVQASWLKRFDAIRHSGNSSECRSLDELENEVNTLAAAVSGISADLRKAAESRNTTALARALPGLTFFPERTVLPELLLPSEPTRRRARLHRELLPTEMWPAGPGTNRRADDLQPIHDRIMWTVSVPHKQRFGWLARLDEIDKCFNRTASLSANDKIEALVSEIDAVAADLRSVVAALGAQASRCRVFWRP